MGARLEGVSGTKKYIRQQTDRMLKAFLAEIDRLAMKVVTAIRDSEVSFWNDHTGNLRSSVGYIIMYNGVVVSENFKVCNGRGQEGMAKGRSYAEELARRYPKGIVLIIVAGMEYAAYVENIESRTVLAGGKILAKDLLRDLNASWDRRYGK